MRAYAAMSYDFFVVEVNVVDMYFKANCVCGSLSAEITLYLAVHWKWIRTCISLERKAPWPFQARRHEIVDDRRKTGELESRP